LGSLIVCGLGAILGILDMSWPLPRVLEKVALVAFCIGSLGVLLTFGRFKRRADDDSEVP
jgi:hypothetical protein